jgi:hypothetical protein
LGDQSHSAPLSPHILSFLIPFLRNQFICCRRRIQTFPIGQILWLSTEMSNQSPPHHTHTHTSNTSSSPSSTSPHHRPKPSRSTSLSPSQHDPSQPRSRQRQRPQPQPRTPLEAYFHEQSKLFSHLQKRFDKFNVRAKDEKARARKERNRPVTTPKPVKQTKTRSKSKKAPKESVKSAEQQVQEVKPLQEEAKSATETMIGSNAGSALRGAVRSGAAVSFGLGSRC